VAVLAPCGDVAPVCVCGGGGEGAMEGGGHGGVSEKKCAMSLQGGREGGQGQ
jgi:hypothetical protein